MTYTEERIPRWRPMVKPGYFYIRDRQYYLYSRKSTCYLRDLKWSKFNIGRKLKDPSEAVVRVSGVKLDDSMYKIVGTYLYIRHIDPPGSDFRNAWINFLRTIGTPYWDFYQMGNLFAPGMSVTVSGTYLQYNDASFGFDEIDHEFACYFQDAIDTFYKFERQPVFTKPIVMTDDEIEEDDSPPVIEFMLEGRNVLFDKVENPVLNHSFEELSDDEDNIVRFDVSDFDVHRFDSIMDISESKPLSWHTDGVSKLCDAHHGFYALYLEASQYAYQNIEIDNNLSVIISFFSKADASTSVQLSIVQRDISDNVLSTDSFDFACDTEWSRHYVACSIKEGLDIEINEDCMSIDIKFVADDELYIDSVYLEQKSIYDSDQTPKDYYRIHDAITVEYETQPIPYCHLPELTTDIDGNFRRSEFQLSDVDCNPMRNAYSNGFLCLIDDGKNSDWQLGKGGFEIDESGVSNAVLGRQHLPYAKINGINKLRQKNAPFSTTEKQHVIEATTHEPEQEPKNIRKICNTHELVNSSGDFITYTRTEEAVLIIIELQDKEECGIEGVDISATSTIGSVVVAAPTDQDGRATIIFSSDISGTGQINISYSSIAKTFDIEVV